jgi:hypothetical protein
MIEKDDQPGRGDDEWPPSIDSIEHDVKATAGAGGSSHS